MPNPKESTAGVDKLSWKIETNQEDINVGIWDFAGHTVTHAVHQFFLSERCLYIMVYDGRTEKRDRLEYWLDHMKNYGGDSKAIILVNKKDENRVDIPINRLKEKYPVLNNYNFNIKEDQIELENLRQEIADYIQNNPSWEKQQIPECHYQVKEALEQYFNPLSAEESKEHIPKEDFLKLVDKFSKDADIDQMLKDLHALGIALWYDKIEDFDDLVLNPEWISNGVYKIVNWVSNQNRHSIKIQECNQVFADEINRYPNLKSHQFLFNLMKNYELAYETDGGSDLIIPHLLNEDRPKELPVFQVGESLQLQYKAEQLLPPNTISRFIVRHHEQIKSDELVWRYGVVLEDAQRNIALVREEDRTISVSVMGTGKTKYISELRDTLNEIFASYKSERPELQYRIVRHGEIPINDDKDLWLSERNIVGHISSEELFFDPLTNQKFPLNYVAVEYNIPMTSLPTAERHSYVKEEGITLDIKNTVKENIISGRLDAAFRECLLYVKNTRNTTSLITLFSRFNDIDQNFNDGVIDFQEYSKFKSQIVKSFLNFIEAI